MPRYCINKCGRRANYALEGDVASYCKGCSTDDMVDVINKTCFIKECSTIPNFNKAGEKIGLYCNVHKLDGMINVVNKTCLIENCSTLPAFNYKNEKVRLYCNEHKLDDMINVVSKTCFIENCSTQPAFNYKNEKIGLYCSEHKLDNMINIKNKLCQYCNLTQSKKHTFSNNDDPELTFEDEVEDITIYSCVPCMIHNHPYLPSSKRVKTKENELVNRLKASYPTLPLILDKQVAHDERRFRPDILIKCKTHNIIIENDEDQHKSYPVECEETRSGNLLIALGCNKLIMIRFNPDSYKDKFDKPHKSCFTPSKNSNSISATKQYTPRYEQLCEVLNLALKNEPVNAYEEHKLFYDGY